MYMQWIENVLNIDRRTSKDPRLYCAYCDMKNHPRFACKHAYKHRIETEKHRCTLCSVLPCSISLSKGSMQWRKRKAKLGSNRIQASKARISIARSSMGTRCSPVLMASSVQEPQQPQSPSEDQQPMCAATAMMHGIPSGAASSWQGAACPPIHEHRQWAPPATENDVILPNPGYQVDANI